MNAVLTCTSVLLAAANVLLLRTSLILPRQILPLAAILAWQSISASCQLWPSLYRQPLPAPHSRPSPAAARLQDLGGVDFLAGVCEAFDYDFEGSRVLGQVAVEVEL